MRSSLFWDLTQRELILADVSVHLSSLIKGQAGQEVPSLTAWPLNVGPTCAETSVPINPSCVTSQMSYSLIQKVTRSLQQ
jgi:hypothetical protein